MARTKIPADDVNSLSELQLLVALMGRIEAEAKRQDTTAGMIVKGVTHDTRFWRDMVHRRAFLETGVNPEGVEKTRSMSLELRDRLRDALTKLERKQAATAA